MRIIKSLFLVLLLSTVLNCKEDRSKDLPTSENPATITTDTFGTPLVDHMYTADPSAHVFNDTLYIYPSHDYEAGIPEDDYGNHFAMRDYHVLSMDQIGGRVKDHGVVLDIDDVPWAGRQMWAPDAAKKGDNYYLYFPVKDKKDVFHIGVAQSDRPEGPFKAGATPIPGSYSIDPAVFQEGESYYMYFGGIWGGQLQWYEDNTFVDRRDTYPADNAPALMPKIVKLDDTMKGFAEAPKDILIVDKEGAPLKQGDADRRFFEGAWVHKYKNTYYLSYSTGDTHNIVYATATNPYGPFTFQGKILEPVLGWTTHHSIVEFKGKWYLFYHDSSLSKGKTHLRSVKVAELFYNEDGTIQMVQP